MIEEVHNQQESFTKQTQKTQADAKTNASKNLQPVLNGKYALMSRLGEGNTSKVYLAQTLDTTR